MADALWLEALDFSKSVRLSDAALEVLVVELAFTEARCVGLFRTHRCRLKVIQFHGPHLKRLVCVDCAGFTSDPLSELRADHWKSGRRKSTSRTPTSPSGSRRTPTRTTACCPHVFPPPPPRLM